MVPLTSSRLALNLITLGLNRPFEQILDACVEHGINTISPWQDHYARIGVQRAVQLLQERSITVNTLCRMSGFGAADSPQAWQDAVSDAHRVIDDAAALRAASVTVIGGGLATNSKSVVQSRDRIVRGINQVLPAARSAGVILAIEPLHPMVTAERGAINTIAQATQIATQAGAGAGVMIDAYNSWWDPTLADSVRAARGRIAGFQISDWLVPTTDPAFDRGMMGDGVIDLPQLRRLVEEAGYDGPVEVEILSARWSALPIDQVLAQVISRFCSVC